MTIQVLFRASQWSCIAAGTPRERAEGPRISMLRRTSICRKLGQIKAIGTFQVWPTFFGVIHRNAGCLQVSVKTKVNIVQNLLYEVFLPGIPFQHIKKKHFFPTALSNFQLTTCKSASTVSYLWVTIDMSYTNPWYPALWTSQNLLVDPIYVTLGDWMDEGHAFTSLPWCTMVDWTPLAQVGLLPMKAVNSIIGSALFQCSKPKGVSGNISSTS